jgi:hypothetical protein
MVWRPSSGQLELLSCGASSKARRLALPTRVGHPVRDVAAPTAKVFRIRADPGALIATSQRSQAEVQHSAWAPGSAPGSALGSGISRALPSAQAVLQSEAVVSFTQLLAPHEKSQARPSRAARNRRSRSAMIRAPTPASSSAGVTCPSAPRTWQSPRAPLRSRLSPEGERERPFRAINRPSAVRLNRPARSSDSSTSPRRSFLTARLSRSFARVSINQKIEPPL